MTDLRQDDRDLRRMTPYPRVYHKSKLEPAPIVDVEDGARGVIVRPTTFGRGDISTPHRHRFGQLIHALTGLLVVHSPRGSWIVPRGRGVWVPPMLEHAV